MLRKIHRGSAVLLLLFIAVHLASHLVAFAGIEAHTQVLKTLRTFYRATAVEALLLGAVLAQIVTGSILVYRGRRTRYGFWPHLRAWSGIALALFLLQHVSAVLVGRLFQGLDTNFYFASAVLQNALLKFYFYPYYFAGVTSVFVHLAAVVYLRRGNETRRRILAYGLITKGVLLALAILLCFGGAFYTIQLPQAYVIK
ncbi:MAG: hypothetical protein U1F40_12160 [Turneriella sp.]